MLSDWLGRMSQKWPMLVSSGMWNLSIICCLNHLLLCYASPWWLAALVKWLNVLIHFFLFDCREVTRGQGHTQFPSMTYKIAAYCQWTSQWHWTLRSVLQRRKKPSWWSRVCQMMRLALISVVLEWWRHKLSRKYFGFGSKLPCL